jgi:hypothetical protein
MTRVQLTEYLRLLDRVTAGGVVYLKQWANWHNPADDVTLRFDAYPIPTGWKPCFHERVPIQTRFRQAVWRLPPDGVPIP